MCYADGSAPALAKALLGTNFYGYDWNLGKRGGDAIISKAYMDLLKKHAPDLKWDDSAREHMFDYKVCRGALQGCIAGVCCRGMLQGNVAGVCYRGALQGYVEGKGGALPVELLPVTYTSHVHVPHYRPLEPSFTL